LFQITYQEAWDLQTNYHKDLISKKLEWRKLAEEDKALKQQMHHLIFCEHKPVYTLGKSGSMDNLLMDEQGLESESIEFFKINRGGDITYHGPGQITGYPIFDLDEFFTDVHKYVRLLEEVIIQTMKEFGLNGMRLKEHTGVWLEPNQNNPQYRKICAIGVHLSRWVTMHGFAFNVNTNLDYFNNIIPCGIKEDDKTVTSMEKELGRALDLKVIREILKTKFKELFDFKYN
jgi:lipoyl(octanoyl) transferase